MCVLWLCFFVDLGWMTLSQGKASPLARLLQSRLCLQLADSEEKCCHPTQKWSSISDCLTVTKLAGE